MPTIAIDADAFKAVRDFAEQSGASTEFNLGFARLLDVMSSFCINTETDAPLGTYCRGNVWLDRPHSFNWALYQKRPGEEERCFYNGGLVHFGPADDGNGGAPSHTVNLGRVLGTTPRAHEWSIHT